MCVSLLVAEDFVDFRRLIGSILSQSPNLKVACEVCDGQDAVQKAADLKPDLILLDIGLPTLNGLDAARQIRKIAPQSKIIFVTQESSPDFVQKALGLGACGYVVKSKIQRDLLAAVNAVLEGRQFVSSGLSG
jgi:DNA-binding NarL/FixJ family response regulator